MNDSKSIDLTGDFNIRLCYTGLPAEGGVSYEKLEELFF